MLIEKQAINLGNDVVLNIEIYDGTLQPSEFKTGDLRVSIIGDDVKGEIDYAVYIDETDGWMKAPINTKFYQDRIVEYLYRSYNTTETRYIRIINNDPESKGGE